MTLALANFGLAVSSAQAAVSWHGDDYSYDYNARVYLRACDSEADGKAVKGVYDFDNSGGSDGSITDGDGANGVCASKNTGGVINRHRTCEVKPLWPDDCGNWQAT